MNIEELKRLAEDATPGPWATGFFGTHCVMGIGSDMQKKDAAYIAAANPTAILELIRQRDELLAALKDIYNAIDCCHDLTPDLLRRVNSIITKTDG